MPMNPLRRIARYLSRMTSPRLIVFGVLGSIRRSIRPRAHLDRHGIRVGGDRLGPRLRAGLVGGSVEYRVGPDGERVGAGRQPLGDLHAEPHTGGVGGVGGDPVAPVRGTADSASERPGRPSSHGQAPVEPGHRRRCPGTPPSGSASRSRARGPRARPPRRSGRSGGRRGRRPLAMTSPRASRATSTPPRSARPVRVKARGSRLASRLDETISGTRSTSGPSQTSGHSNPSGSPEAVTRMGCDSPRRRIATSSIHARPPRGTFHPPGSCPPPGTARSWKSASSRRTLSR